MFGKKAITKIQAIAVTAIILVAAVAGVVYYITRPPEKEEILFGAAISQTGSYGPLGSLILDGYRLWEEDVNDRGGILGHPVRIIAYDDGSDPTTTKALAERLITVDNVDFLLGPYTSSCAMTMQPVAEEYKKVVIQPINNAKSLYSSDWEYVFLYSLTGITDNQMIPYLQIYEDLLPSDERPTTVGVILTADVYPRAVTDGLYIAADKFGLDVTFREELPKGTTDVTAAVIKLMDADPDVLFIFAYFAEGTLLVRTMKEMGYTPRGLSAPELIQSWPEAVNAITAEPMEYMIGHTGYDVDYDYDANEYFVEKFQEANPGKDPSRYQVCGWSSAMILEAAIKGVGRFDDQSLIRDWLIENSVETPAGVWEIDDDLVAEGIKYVPTAIFIIDQVINGEPKHIWPVEDKEVDFVYPAP